MQRIIINGQEVDLDAIAQVTNGKTKKSEPKERREAFIGDALEIFDLHASIDIQPSNGNKITVSVTGPESIVDRLQIIEKDGTVSISDSKGGKSSGATIIQNIRGGHIGSMTIDNVGTIGNFGGVTVISGDDIVINTGDTESAKLSLKITAPIIPRLTYLI